MGFDGRALAATGIGALFLWSGVKGWSVLGTVGDIVTGKRPDQAEAYPILDPTAGPSVVEGTAGVFDAASQAAAARAGGLVGVAMSYQGHAYRFAGAPGSDGTKPWDCSSFVNFCVGVKLGKAIPGYGAGKYNGNTHGPSSAQWAIWPGTTRITKAELQSGDIIVWGGHIGIAISNTQMISALNPSVGTKVSSIEGQATGPVVRYGRF